MRNSGSEIENVEKSKIFFKRFGKLLDIIGLLGVVGGILLGALIIFGGGEGKYGYIDIVFIVGISSLFVFLGAKIARYDFYSGRYIILSLLIAPTLLFSAIGIIFFVILIIQGIRGLLKIRELRGLGLFHSVFGSDSGGKIGENSTGIDADGLSRQAISNAPFLSNQQMMVSPNKEFPGNLPKNLKGHTVSEKAWEKSIHTPIISTAAILIGIGLFYSFGYAPFKKNYDFNQCLKKTEETFSQKHQEITSHVNSLETEQILIQQEIDEKMVEFLKNNPEPKQEEIIEYPTSFADKLRVDLGWKKKSAEYTLWEVRKNGILDPIKNVDAQIRNIKSDFDKIEDERVNSEENCYKRYR